MALESFSSWRSCGRETLRLLEWVFGPAFFDELNEPEPETKPADQYLVMTAASTLINDLGPCAAREFIKAAPRATARLAERCSTDDARCRDLEKRVVELEERLKTSEATNASLARVLESTQAQLERANAENTMLVTSEYTASLVPNPLALAAELKKLYGDDRLEGDTEFWAHLIETANSGIALPSGSFVVKSRFLDDSEFEKPIPARQHNCPAPDPMGLAKTLKRMDLRGRRLPRRNQVLGTHVRFGKLASRSSL